ncbi:MAG TPA: 30S ribosomal protein S20 [bacterium]|jgi:small subunit ribosomal protein S20|nr:30S ribosomal protein S20 [bacterium]
MANIKSARKRVRISEKQRLRNSMVKSRLRTAVRRFHEAVVINDPEQVKQALNNAFSVIDKAATKGVIHKNKAARQKALLSRQLNTMETAVAE